MPVLELDVVPQRQRARADERHVAEHDVQHLRHLVDRVAAQDAADPRHPRVVLDLEQRPRRLVRLLEPGLPAGRVGVHRAELEHAELALAEADALVAVEDGTRRVQLHPERDQPPDRQRDQDQQTADDDVERTLDRPVETGEHRRPQLEQRHALAGDVLRPLPQQLGGGRRDPHLDAGAVRLLDEVEQLLLAEVDAADDQLVEGLLLQHAREVGDGAEHRQPRGRSVGREHADELVVDPAAAEPERAPQRDQPFAAGRRAPRAAARPRRARCPPSPPRSWSGAAG